LTLPVRTRITNAIFHQSSVTSGISPPFESGNYALKLSSPLFGGQGIEFTDVAPQAFQVGIGEGYARFMIVLCCQHGG
jgi:hypothetical protein